MSISLIAKTIGESATLKLNEKAAKRHAVTPATYVGSPSPNDVIFPSHRFAIFAMMR